MKYIDRKLVKFLIVGIINTIIGSSIMFLLYNVGKQSYWFSSACNYVAGGIVSFFLNKYFTFQNKDKSLKQIFLFILNLLLCYFIAYYFSKRVIFFLLDNYSEKVQNNVALFAGMCLYTILNYLGQRLLVFSSIKNKNGEA